jgi:hypothetical protein
MIRELPIAHDQLDAFCRRWKVRELSLFGSAARGEQGERSDLDFLVTFDDRATWSLLDHVTMQSELAELVGRPVDLVTRRAVERAENRLRRERILSEARPVYVS